MDFEVCPSSGKICYVTPMEGYLNHQNHNRSARKKSGSRVRTAHYKCGDCRMFHLVTQYIKTPRKDR